MIRPFEGFIQALRDKDEPLYRELGHLPPGIFAAEWNKRHPEDFVDGGASRADASSIVPLETFNEWDTRVPNR